MLSVYPYGSGSLYNAEYAITSSFAQKVEYINYVVSASQAGTILFPEQGPRGKSVCLLTTAQYKEMITSNPPKVEVCNIPP